MDFPAQYARTRRFSSGAPRNLSVAGARHDVYFLRAKQGDDPVLCLWRLDTMSGDETLLADPRALLDQTDPLDQLPPAERARRERAREGAGGIVEYSTAGEGPTTVFALNGCLFVHRDSLATQLPCAPGVYDPRLDPTASAVAYVAGDELHLQFLDESGSDRVIATDTDQQVSWGRAEFIAAEEMNRGRGYWWSPDGTQLLACRVDNSLVDSWWIADPANPQRAPLETRYPAAGTTNASVELWLLDRERPLLAIDWSDSLAYEYLGDVLWSEGHAPLVVRQTRDQRTISIGEIDLADGSVRERHRITDQTWVEFMPGSPAWAGDDLLTIEDVVTCGQDHRALCRNGVAISHPSLNVRSILSVDAAIEPVEVVVSTWTDPTEVHLAVVTLPTADALAPNEYGGHRLLTSEPGVHGGAVTDGLAVIISSTPLTPGPAVTVRSVGRNRPTSRDFSVRSFVETPIISARPQWCGTGKELRSALFMPDGHDGVTPLPVLLDPYGGPHAQRVVKSHNAHLVSQWFADQGFAVLVTDGRGTPGRGPAFERAVWGDLAQPILDDQLEALDRVAAEHGMLDLDRVGIRGWSFGGYLAALAVLRRPDRIHAAVAGAPVTTWRLYDTHYTERYLGHPEAYPDHYDRTDLILEAAQLSRPLLLVHGLADDNVVAAHTLRLSSALLANGRAHSVLPLSGVTHMTPQVATAENLLRIELDFLNSALAPRAGTAA